MGLPQQQQQVWVPVEVPPQLVQGQEGRGRGPLRVRQAPRVQRVLQEGRVLEVLRVLREWQVLEGLEVLQGSLRVL